MQQAPLQPVPEPVGHAMSIDPPPPASQDDNTQPPDWHGVHTRRHREKDSEIAELGGKIAIMHDLYRPFDQALLAGLAYDPNTPAENLNSSQLKYIEVWNLLDESIPGLEQRLRKEGTPGVSVVSNKLQGGRRSTLAACVDNVKKCSRDWGFVPPLPAEKRDRGFYNDVCGRLLCPAHLDWDDPTVRAGLRNHEYRTYRIGSSRLPRLLWADGVMGDIPSVGFLRNELLLKTVALILRGPEAAKVVTSVGGPPMHYSVNSKPRAAIWHIYRVTPGCIAASATLLRFALSSHTRFSLSADQEQVNHEEVVTATIWPYRAFYQRIQRCFQVMPEGMRNELLDWYTQRVLGDAAFYSDGDDESDVDGESELATLETAFGQGNDN